MCSSELIEELASRRNMKIGMQVSNDMTTINFYDLSEIFTPLQKEMENNFTPFLYKIYNYTITMEIIVRHYNRLSLLLIKPALGEVFCSVISGLSHFG